MSGPVGLEDLPDPTVVLDASQRVVALNDAAVRLVARPRAEIVGRSLADGAGLTDEEDRPVWSGGWGAAARLRGVRLVPEQPARLRRPDGRSVPVLATAAFRRGPGGALTGAVVALRDPRRRARGDQAMETVAAVAHELRSPLTSLRGHTRLLLEHGEQFGDADRRAMLAEVQADAGRVARMIGELLDVSRLESGRLRLRPRAVDVPAVVASALGAVREGYPELRAATQWAPGIPAVWADPDRVLQVLVNLLENACRYAGGRGIVVAAARVGEQVEVRVSDSGPGIAPGEREAVFARHAGGGGDRPAGTGLGLWISRSLVEAHGGRLELDSTLGAGSTFRFTLPAS
ncbi:MAG TPA: PAS domain-containing sensor histidine kinase [Acidimicrobiales bacterium]|nr:PAS domain-containing sensor histidine kinase [Acidimicrobiales bacterium]